MANSYFQFKQFTVQQDRCAMKVTTDGCLFGAWCANKIQATTKEKSASVLDIGAGTGLLSLMVAQKNKVVIDAVEIDTAAAKQAKENVAASPWSERIKVVYADALRWQPPHGFDFILSNPPFYDNDLRSDKPSKNLAHHDAGLKMQDLLAFIKRQLKEDGLFFLLLPSKRIDEAEKLIKETGLVLQEKVFVKQTPKHSPFRVMAAGGRNKVGETKESMVAIKEEEGYTLQATSLLKDYYLHL